ncbi:acyl-CoA dehydrogenase family protein [Bordetella sp. BOR01]|uniref:acyl-CoA dehydrogenase family protein n=1 Tax=Bordetella sp. BOR01 TaxID=2854779 RepID=UPI001C481F0D|nr:acyl-CoA dehydrogenase family protein [Bordetella sp. BOR01]MBV7486837.1 acyl-CoA/acyl-ACP dehydrogenase [Bordetella sp. BOR01]
MNWDSTIAEDQTEEQRLYRQSLHRVMSKLATPEYLARIDRDAQYPYEIYDAWIELGLFRIGFPEEYGGLGGGLRDLVLISQDLAYWSYDVYTAYSVPLYTAMTLLKIGSEAQKQEFLPALMDGRLRLSTSISEPSAGSDVSAIKTFARRAEGGWVLNGQKLWNTAAGSRGNVLQVLARTNGDVAPRKGMSMFLVPNDTQGVECRKLDMLGRRATGTYEVFFTDVFVPDENLVGPLDAGWAGLLACLQTERLLTSAGYVGSAQKVMDLALDYARQREQFGRPIGDFQVIAHMLADMQTEVDAARLLVDRATATITRGADATKDVSMAKLYGSETYAAVARRGMQIMGAYGYSMEFEMQRHFRDSCSTTVGAGSSQMQRNAIAATLGLKPR